METPPTAAPPLAPVSLAPSSAPHFNSLASGLNPHWGQPSWVLTPTLAVTQVLSLEQRLEDMKGRKIAEDKDELLKDFISQFNRTTLGIKDLQMSGVVTAMMSGTRSRPFKMSLFKNLPNTMYELLKRGDKYVDAKETYLITKSMRDRNESESNKRKFWDEPEPRNDKDK
ncbi:Uncharacterized protein Adt_18586 [Abeliophyllum distichum]|uniref:Uncharacterized protein n=1 Tax=Abeliophyllum distichum TaxID=126358 RepID=A0ABD1TJS0_9LAMI